MAIITLEDVKGELGLTDDQTEDHALITRKIDAAQNHIERMLGFVIEDRFPVAGDIPPALREAVAQLAVWWFENREAATEMSRELPFGVRDIVDGFREWTF